MKQRGSDTEEVEFDWLGVEEMYWAVKTSADDIVTTTGCGLVLLNHSRYPIIMSGAIQRNLVACLNGGSQAGIIDAK